MHHITTPGADSGSVSRRLQCIEVETSDADGRLLYVGVHLTPDELYVGAVRIGYSLAGIEEDVDPQAIARTIWAHVYSRLGITDDHLVRDDRGDDLGAYPHQGITAFLPVGGGMDVEDDERRRIVDQMRLEWGRYLQSRDDVSPLQAAVDVYEHMYVDIIREADWDGETTMPLPDRIVEAYGLAHHLGWTGDGYLDEMDRDDAIEYILGHRQGLYDLGDGYPGEAHWTSCCGHLDHIEHSILDQDMWDDAIDTIGDMADEVLRDCEHGDSRWIEMVLLTYMGIEIDRQVIEPAA